MLTLTAVKNTFICYIYDKKNELNKNWSFSVESKVRKKYVNFYMNWNISHQILSRLIWYLYTLSICQQLSRLSLLLIFQNLMRNIWWIRCEYERNKTLLCSVLVYSYFSSLSRRSTVRSPLLSWGPSPFIFLRALWITWLRIVLISSSVVLSW